MLNDKIKTKEHPTFANRARITSYRDGKIVKQSPWFKNIVVLSANNGRNLIMQALSEDYTGSLAITHAELGTGTTPETENDTATEAGAVRAQKSYSAVSTDQLSIKFFFSDAALPDDDYSEITLWIDGTASVSTGHLFNHLVFSASPHTKSAGEDTSVELLIQLDG